MAIRAYVNRLTPSEARGWAQDIVAPTTPVSIKAVLGAEAVATTVADGFRDDLVAAGIGSGHHGFSIRFPTALQPADLGRLKLIALGSSGAVLEMPLPAPQDERPGREPRDPQAAVHETLIRKVLRLALPFAESKPLGEPKPAPVELLKDPTLDSQMRRVEIQRLLAAADVTPETVKQALAKDHFPIPADANREGYAPGRDLPYWIGGYVAYRVTSRLAAQYGVTEGRYLDFGGSTGRVFRNFALQSDAWEVWACDFKTSSVEFCLRYLPPKVRVFANTSLPSLPLPDGYFDLVSACSVFTHIDETETSWLLELRRILRVGGVACLTVVNEDSWGDPGIMSRIARLDPELGARSVMPPGKTVLAHRDDDPYFCLVLHHNDYIRNVWGRYFEICTIVPRTSVSGVQAMVVCRRTD